MSYNKCLAWSVFALLPALAWAAPAHGQASTSVVAGVVLESEARAAIAGADVILVGTGQRVASSALGEFRFDNLEPGIVVLRIEHPSYATRTDTLAVAPGERVEVRLTLSADAIELEPINIVARRGTLGTGLTGQFPGMTRTEIEEVLPRTRHLADLIRTGNFPGVRIRENSLPGLADHGYCVEMARADNNLQGPNACYSMNVYIDGRPALDPMDTFTTLDPDLIERFEILGPIDAAAIYGGGGARGVILIETRTGMGTTNRRLPVFERDLAPVTIALALTRGSGSDLYDGAAFFTFDQRVATVRYEERSRTRPGLRASARVHTWGWFPEVELTAFGNGGESSAVYQDGTGSTVREVHDFNTFGIELVARPRVTKGERWDLSMLLGPVWARESIDVRDASDFPGASTLGSVVAERISRSWSTVGAVVGGEFEWVLGARSSLLFGMRWRALSLGDGGADITDQDAIQGRELLHLPQANRRNGRRSLEIGYVRRFGGMGG